MSSLATAIDTQCWITLVQVHAGEIVGLAGVVRNGQTELVDVLIGWRSVEEGHILITGRDLTRSSIMERRQSGLVYIPDD